MNQEKIKISENPGGKKRMALRAAIYILAIVGILFAINLIFNKEKVLPEYRTKLNKNQNSEVVTIREEIVGELIVNMGEEVQSFKEKVSQGSTVFDLMKKINENQDFSFNYSESQMGVFVEEIQGVRNDSAQNKYWLFKVNGQFGEKGIYETVLKKGDKVEWNYEDTSQMGF